MIIQTILSLISKPLTTVVERLIPDKTKQEEFKHEFNMTVLQEAAENEKQFSERLIAEIQHPNILRDAVRPIITYFSFGLYAYIKITVVYVASKVYIPLITNLLTGNTETVYQKLPEIKGILSEFSVAIFSEFDFYLLLTIFTFWFGGKLLERFTEKATGNGGIRALLFGIKDNDKK